MTNPLVPGLIGLIIGVPVGFYLRNLLLAQNADAQKRVAHGRKQDAEREARGILREAEIQGRSEVLKAREAFESSVKEQRKQLQEIGRAHV